MTTKPKTITKFRRKRKDTQMGTIEKMYGKDFGIKTLKSDKEIREYYKGKKYEALRGLIIKT